MEKFVKNIHSGALEGRTDRGTKQSGLQGEWLVNIHNSSKNFSVRRKRSCGVGKELPLLLFEMRRT